MERENKETKIASVEKERVKDPRRVEQGKRLAAISREAKERKARDRAQRLKEEAEQQREADSFNLYMAIVPMVGIAVGGYYLFYLRRPNNKEDRPEEEEEKPKKKRKLKKL